MHYRPAESNRLETRTRLDEVRLAVPRQLRIVGDGASARLLWSIDNGWQQGEPASGCLQAFMRLAHGDDAQSALRFAERFGVLGVQADGRPGKADESPGLPPQVVENGATWRVEPLVAWFVYARHARALLVLVEALRRRIAALGPIDAAKVLREARALDGVPVEEFSAGMARLTSYSVASLMLNLDRLMEHGLATQRLWLGHVLTLTWLEQSSLKPCLRWNGPAPALDVDMASIMDRSRHVGLWSPFALFSVLASQLAAAFTNGGLYAQCSACGEFFMPGNRRARKDRSRFCGVECRLDGERRRKRESAAKRRARERATD